MSKEEVRLGVACVSSFVVGIVVTLIIVVLLVRIELRELESALIDHSCIKFDEVRNEFIWVDENTEVKVKL